MQGRLYSHTGASKCLHYASPVTKRYSPTVVAKCEPGIILICLVNSNVLCKPVVVCKENYDVNTCY